jgi:hypothetical protein
MPTKTKKKPRVLVGTRISADAYERLLKRVERASNRSGVQINLGAALRALIEEHA